MRDGRGHNVEHHLYLTAEQVGERRRGAAIRDVNHVDVGHHLEQLAGHVCRVSGARRGHVERSAGGWRARVDVEDEIVRELRVERRVDKIARNDVKKRVAVWASAHDEFCGNRAASAWSVVNDEWLAEALRQPLAYQARADIGCLAWGKPH